MHRINKRINRPVKHNHQHTAGGRESLKPRFAERVGLQLSILEGSNRVLGLLIITVQDRQVKIGRSLVYIWVLVVGLEDIFSQSAYYPKFHQGQPTMNDQSCPVEEKTGHLVRMGIELPASKETVEDQAGIRQSTRLDGQRLDGTSVGRVCSS